MPTRIVLRSVHEEARDDARQLATSAEFARSRRERKKTEMLFAHLKRRCASSGYGYEG